MKHSLWQPLPWQERLWAELAGQFKAQRLHHALLLSGPAGVGKGHFARAFAAWMLCDQPSDFACGQCSSCTRLAAGTQPNAALISQDGHLGLNIGERSDIALAHWQPDDKSAKKDIAIHAVRSFLDQAHLTAHHGRPRVAVVEPADKLNQSSLNAFLKTVEEPPRGMHLLLVTAQPSLIRPTLTSRCQRLRFAAPRHEQAMQWLAAQGVQNAGALLAQAHSAPLRALALASGDEAAHQREWEQAMTRLAQQKADPLTVAAEVGKDEAARFLRWCAGWLTSLMRNGDRLASAQVISRFYGEVLDTARKLEQNAKADLMLEALLILWWRLCKPARA